MPQSKGRKKQSVWSAEATIHGLPKLDPEADVSAVQLVGPQTSRKEIKSLYYEVYKLWRLLGSPQSWYS